MKSKNLLLILRIIILSMICIIGCENDNVKPNMDFVYPLTVGNSWEYEKLFTLDFDSLATFNGLTDTTFYSTGFVEIIAYEVIFDSLEVYNFSTTITEDGNVLTGNEFYNNNDNSLISYGYINPFMFTPKSNENFVSIIFDDKKFSDVREIFDYIKRGIIGNDYSKNDSIYYDPVKCLEYPLRENNQWIYRTYDIRIDKTIIGVEKIDVPAGEFNCWKIQWTYPELSFNDDIEFYDFVSHEGLVQRLIEFKNMAYIDEFGNFIGYLNSTEETYLTDYQIYD
ncbi:MAG: hypothetical protein HQ534_09650 [Armatimonadetes bacterium]|nr:hypothetical protein [Armatimonadota bacterium]